MNGSEVKFTYPIYAMHIYMIFAEVVVGGLVVKPGGLYKAGFKGSLFVVVQIVFHALIEPSDRTKIILSNNWLGLYKLKYSK